VTTQDKISNILTLARHLLNTQDGAHLHVAMPSPDEWSVWIEYEGVTLRPGNAVGGWAAIEDALDAFLETLTASVHKQMEDATKLLDALH